VARAALSSLNCGRAIPTAPGEAPNLVHKTASSPPGFLDGRDRRDSFTTAGGTEAGFDLANVKEGRFLTAHTADVDATRLTVLLLHIFAAFWFGIMAGSFGTYSANVAQATGSYEGPLYAVVQSSLNRNVRHALFFAFFFLPPGWCALALLVGWRQRASWSWWLLCAAILYAIGVIIFTHQVNLPLNAYTESWDPANLPADWAQTRARWNAANAWRAAVSSLAFLMSLIALSLYAARRTTPALSMRLKRGRTDVH
jgi:uncharacterized membrane protein